MENQLLKLVVCSDDRSKVYEVGFCPSVVNGELHELVVNLSNTSGLLKNKKMFTMDAEDVRKLHTALGNALNENRQTLKDNLTKVAEAMNKE